MEKNIIIIGARGYHKNYGGWETFVTNLIDNYQDETTNFFVPEISHSKKENHQTKIINRVKCTTIYTASKGSATMMIFVAKAIYYYRKLIKKEKLKNVILYIIGCRVGPLFLLLRKSFKKLGVTIMINPDGLEWQRSKWNYLIKQYLKFSEYTMVKMSDYVICDSRAIKKYFDKKYHLDCHFIAYGAYLNKVNKNNTDLKRLFNEFKLVSKQYYLIVARFVPENNYELIIKEFMKTKTNKDLVIVSNVEINNFYHNLLASTNFKSDSRIKIIGPVYDQDLLKQIRSNAYAYVHGHSAGGTNPSLLESLSISDLHLVFKVPYNEEVCQDAAVYFNSDPGDLKKVLENLERLNEKDIATYQKKAIARIKKDYTWDFVVRKYRKLFDLAIQK